MKRITNRFRKNMLWLAPYMVLACVAFVFINELVFEYDYLLVLVMGFLFFMFGALASFIFAGGERKD